MKYMLIVTILLVLIALTKAEEKLYENWEPRTFVSKVYESKVELQKDEDGYVEQRFNVEFNNGQKFKLINRTGKLYKNLERGRLYWMKLLPEKDKKNVYELFEIKTEYAPNYGFMVYLEEIDDV